MPIPGRTERPRTRDTVRDPRAVAVVCAAIVAALMGMGQLLIAHVTGVLFARGGIDTSLTQAVDESAIVIWIAAVAVCLGAATPRMFLATGSGRRMRLALVSAAACGAVLSAPVATAFAAWGQVYAGNLSQPTVLRLVCIGVVLGAAVAAAAVRSQAAAWSLTCWVGVVWVLLLASAVLSPGSTPVISHLDLGPQWSPGTRFMQGSMLLLVVAAGCGAGLGAVGIKHHWARELRRYRSGVPLMAVAGPLVVLAAYLAAGFTAGAWNGGYVVSLTAAGCLAVAGSWAGACLTRKTRRAGRPAGSLGA